MEGQRFEKVVTEMRQTRFQDFRRYSAEPKQAWQQSNMASGGRKQMDIRTFKPNQFKDTLSPNWNNAKLKDAKKKYLQDNSQNSG